MAHAAGVGDEGDEAAASHGSRAAGEEEDGEGDRRRDPARGRLDGDAAEDSSVAEGQVHGGSGEVAGPKEVGGGR